MAAETVTVLFTDLVGSTELMSSVGPDDAERLRQEHFALLRTSVQAAGGREVKNVGDGLMVAFSGAAAAVGCAVDIQRRLDVRNREAAEPLMVRVGLSTGEADVDGGDYFGPPVVEAARLCAAARGGQILTTDVVRVLVGARGGHAFSPLGLLELKGLPEPIASVEVGWVPASGEDVIGLPLPGRLDQAPAMGLVGRDDEIDLLRQALKDVQNGSRRAVLIGGEAGIGKTALTAQFAVEAHAAGAAVLYGRCDEELAIPYQPWAEALRHLIEHLPIELLTEHVALHGGEVARLVPELRRVVSNVPPPSASDPEVVRFELFGAVVGLLGAVAAKTPVCLVLDDLHWADVQTLLLLRHVIGYTTDRLLIAGTYRDVELTETHPLSGALAALRREAGVGRVLLRGLHDDDTVALLERMSGVQLDASGVSLAHALYRETDGNPFFTLEVVRHLVDSGVLVRAEDGRWSAAVDLADVGLPASVREVIGQRIRALGDATHTVLSQAAVVGRDFALDVLVPICERAEDELLDVLESAVAAGVVIEDGDGFAFTHSLIQHSLYEALGSARRRRLHLRVAQTLEELCGDDPGARVGELARHWAAATTPLDAAKAISYARQAGERALDALAPEDAVAWFSQAIELHEHQSGDESLRCDLLIGLGIGQRQISDPNHRQTLLDAADIALAHGDAQRLAHAALANNAGRFSATGQVDVERLQTLQSALRLLGPGDSSVCAELLATEAVELSWSADWARRHALAEEAIAMARRIGDPATLVRVIVRVFHALYSAHTHDLRYGYAMEALALTAELRDPGLRWAALDRALLTLLDAGDLVRFDELAAEQRVLASRLAEPILRFDTEHVRATRAVITGHISEAQDAVDALLASGPADMPEVAAAWGTLAGVLSVRRGELEALLPMIELAMHDWPDLPAIHASLASLYCELGRLDEARTLLDTAAANDFTDLPRDRIWLTAAASWADTAADLGAHRAASALYAELEPFAQQVLPPSLGAAEGPVAFHLGRLATTLTSYDEAETHFTEAAELCTQIGAHYWLCRNQLAHARMVQNRNGAGDPERVRKLLDEAREIANREGYRHLEQQANRLLLD